MSDELFDERPRCPYCHSQRTTVPPKATAASYRRCEACGQLWHPERIPQTRLDRGRP